jgi:tetratricopeptide (TPR) repeat protein
MAVWREVAYFGVGLPLGIVAGMGLFVIYKSLFGVRREITGPNERVRLFLLAGLLAAIVGHYVEINFGIAILATRTYFWVFAALIVAVGYLLPLHGEYRDSADIKAEPAAIPVDDRGGKIRKKTARTSLRTPQRQAEWLQNAWAYGWILGLLLMSLGYSLILNNTHLTNPFAIIWNALTSLSIKNEVVTSFGILGLFLMTVVFGGLLLTAEAVKDEIHADWKKAVRTVVGVSLISGIVFWVWNASELAILESIKPSDYEGMIGQINRIGGLLTWFYIFVVILLILMAFSLRERTVAKGNPETTPSWIAGGIASILAVFLILFTNLKIVHADITFKMAEPFNKPNQWQTASNIYDYANQQAPNEDHYFLFLARSYMEQAKEVTQDNEVAQLVETTEQKLQRAQRINPLNTDHTANLARLFTWYAGKSTVREERAARAEKAFQYYDTALKLSPNNSTLWGEWASLLIRIMNRPDDAYQMIQKALDLDQKYTLTQGLAGDYWVTKASTETDEAKKADYYASAAEHYLAAARSARTRDEAAGKLEYLKRSGNIYIELNRLQEAATAYEELIKANPTAADVWSYEETLAKIYMQLNDKTSALAHAQAALIAAPPDKEAQVQSLIDQIQAMP